MRNVRGRASRGRIVFFVIVAILVIACVMWLANRDVGSRVEVSVDGASVASFELADEGEHLIETEYGVNVIEIAEGAVRVQSADCPNQDCVRHGWIENAGESIVCLPHHLTVVVVVEGEGAALDAVAR